MKHIITIVLIIVYSGIAYLIGLGLTEMYLSALNSQSGLVMARDQLGAKIVPFMLAFLTGYITYKVRAEE